MVAQEFAAAQHRPRPLPLFLDLLRSETAASPERMRDALAGLRLYQQAPRVVRPMDRPAVVRNGRAGLIDYGLPGNGGRPIIFVPSLINPPHVLDLAADTSLLRWLAAQGLRPLLVDWGEPAAHERDLSIAGHVEQLLLPLVAGLGERPVLVGYCLGGTMALAAATLLDVAGVALIAAPWRFGGFPEQTRASMRALWDHTAPTIDALGMLPMEILQTAFWQLDPAKTIAKFERLGRGGMTAAAAAGFVALEDWANDGPPLTRGAGRELLIDMFEGDVTGTGRWMVGGVAVRPERLACPLLDIASTNDRIVPQASAVALGERIALGLGHVGMIVGGRARPLLWEPLAAWLRMVAA